jgi:hypothetical protein
VTTPSLAARLLPAALAQRLGADRTVRLSIATRIIQGVMTVGMLGLVLLRLSPVEQGYFFTQTSLGALQLLTEFGMTYALMQTASHLAHEHHAARLPALFRTALRHNAAATIGGGVIVALIGVAVLGTHGAGAGGEAVHWLGPWLSFVVAIAAYQQLQPRLALLEGAGFTAEVWRWRAVQELVGGLALLGALAAGAGLYASAIGYVARSLFALAWQRGTAALLPGGDDGEVMPWHPVWTFQWRVGLSTLSAFLLFQFLGPLLFAVAGPTIAGRIGLAMTLCNGTIAVSTAWLASQAPTFGRLVSRREYGELDARFRRALGASLLFSAAIASGIVIAVWLAHSVVPTLSPRLPALPVLAPIMAAAVVHHYLFGLATYLRAEREEPLLMLYVLGGLVTAMGLVIAARTTTPVLVAVAYLGFTLVGAAVATAIFARQRAAAAGRP